MKTKKWVNAPSYSYEGDDWGEYDEDDEYGVGSPSGAQAASTSAAGPPPPHAQGPTGGAARSFTNPELASAPSPAPAPGPRRAPSFDAGDERRAFPSGEPPAGPQQGPPLHVQTNVPLENSGNRQASAASLASSNMSDISSHDPRHRSNYSPSAEPPPLQTRNSPAPQTPSQQLPQTSQEQQRAPVPASSGPASAVTPTSAPKLPFVRPADIYKRMEEEREKERRSMDSQRSGSDAAGRRPSDDTTSSQAGLRERSSMDSMGRTSGRRTPLDTVDESTRQDRQPRQPPLPSVAERKSEYGMPESKAQPPAATQAVASTTGMPPQHAPSQPSGLPGAPQLSALPQLPQLGGESTFSDDFWESTPLGASRDAPTSAPTASPPSDAPQSATGLQHAPSLGFRSMVNQAFDQPTRSSTGLSNQDSERSAGDSSVSRSDSAATSDVSPIMSRVPSSAAGGARLQGVQMKDTPTIVEEPSEAAASEPQRHSDATFSGAHQVPRKQSPNPHNGSVDPAAVAHGYRRDLSTPSPNNSPAKTPAVEENKQLPHAEAAELALNSPAEENGAQITPFAAAATAKEATQAPNVAAVTKPSSTVPPTQQAKGAVAGSRNKDLPPIPGQQTSSSGLATKDKAQGLDNSATRIPGISSPANTEDVSEPSLPEKTSTPEPSSQSGVERPRVEQAPSFRPKLPGQWESFATSATDQSEQDRTKELPFTASEQHPETAPSAPQPQVLRPYSEKTPASPAAPVQSLADEQSANQHSHPAVALAAAGVAVGAATDHTHLPEKDSSQPDEEDVPPQVPQKDNSESPVEAAKVEASPIHPAPNAELDSDDAATDFESDRLHKEIVSSLSPVEPSAPKESAEEGLATGYDRGSAFNRDSSILPQIYDSYLSDDKEIAPAERSSVALPEVAPAERSSVALPEVAPAERSSVALPEVAAPIPEESQPETAEHLVFEDGSNAHGRTLTDKAADFGPSAIQPVPLVKRFSWEMDDSNPVSPAPLTAANQVSPIAPSIEGQSKLSVPGDTTPDNPRLSGEGLRVINAAPGEIPPLETTPSASRQIEEPPQTELQFTPQTEQQFSPQTEQQFSTLVAPPVVSLLPATQGVDPKFLSFREIMAVNSPQQRIDNFNRTREQWAVHDSGLSSWLTSMLAARPEYGNISPGTPLPASPGGAKHKATSSISRAFTKPFNQLSLQGQQDAGSPQTPVGPAEAAPSPVQRLSGAKGKDFLEKAGAIGGKGMTGAKGLFAKGRSKFRGSTGGSEKVD